MAGDPAVNYTFYVDIDGLGEMEFKECNNIGTEVQVIEDHHNKIKGLPITRKLPGTTKYNDIELKTGKVKDTKKFWDWIKDVQDGKIVLARKSGTIQGFSIDKGTLFNIQIKDAWPSKVTLGNLAAGGNEVLVDSMTLVIGELQHE